MNVKIYRQANVTAQGCSFWHITKYNAATGQRCIAPLAPASTEGTAITSGGLLAVSESETATTFTVIAKSKVDRSKVGICEITVTE